MWYVTFKVHRSFVSSDYQECHMLFLYLIFFLNQLFSNWHQPFAWLKVYHLLTWCTAKSLLKI